MIQEAETSDEGQNKSGQLTLECSIDKQNGKKIQPNICSEGNEWDEENVHRSIKPHDDKSRAL